MSIFKDKTLMITGGTGSFGNAVDYIFHAAALKQVPSCEFFPMEAVKTNIIRTDDALEMAIDAGAKGAILSTRNTSQKIYRNL